MWLVPQVAGNLLSFAVLHFAVPRFVCLERIKLERSSRRGLQLAALVAEAGADCNTPAALGAAAAEYRGSALGLHAGSEAVSLDAFAAIRLKCALGHGNALLNLFCGYLCLTASFKYSAGGLSNPVTRSAFFVSFRTF
jgi:hypothetical protein